MWTPADQEVLFAQKESNNAFDQYAIAAMKRGANQDKIVGHLPREISRFTWFILSHGASVTIKVVDVRRRRSPLIWGGLEIPVEIAIKMPFLNANKQALEKYLALVNDHYEEPVDVVFTDCTSTVLSALDDELDTNTEDNEWDQE